MTNRIFEPFATVHSYPKGLMNECVCGQVVLAPKTRHENCENK